MLPPEADRPKLAAVLGQLSAAVEEFLLAGMTTASDSTRRTFAAAMQEAARFRLLRLGSTLRLATEELGRLTAQDATFSPRRLTFLLRRSWLLGRGLANALRESDESAFDRLSWTPATVPVPSVEVVCLGAGKKVAIGAFAAFEFRCRAVADSPPVKVGQPLVWSVVFPIKMNLDLPAEGYLHLPQKQKFTPVVFLEKKIIAIINANLTTGEGAARLSLTDASTVAAGKPFADWNRFLDWSPESAIERIRKLLPTPLDIDTELQEEIVLRDYTIGEPTVGDGPGQTFYPISARNLALMAIFGSEVEGKALRANLNELRARKKQLPPLYGLMHYERCRLMFQPLTAFRPDADYLTISEENIDKKVLLKAMSFR